MEKSIGFDWKSCMCDVLKLNEVDIAGYSPLTLAYIGDSVYDLIIKTMVVSEGNKQVKKLHQETSSMVQASAQSEMMRVIQEHLTEEEHAVYKRGRNAKTVSPAKNQTLTDYRRATGFEALMGWLYLKNEWPRMLELIKIGLEHLNKKEEKMQETGSAVRDLLTSMRESISEGKRSRGTKRFLLSGLGILMPLTSV